MGHPKKPKKKYSTPRHPWQKERIDEEKILFKEYGLKNKKEIWRMNSVLKNFKEQVKRLQALTGKQAELEKNQLFDKLLRLGFISEGATFDDVLGLGVKAIMERRLQTMVVRKLLARKIDQARQFITHGHITVSGEKMTSPGYLVPVALENDISFIDNSSLADAMHPERVKEEKMPEKKSKKETKKKEEKAPKKKEKKEKKEAPKKEAKKEEKPKKKKEAPKKEAKKEEKPKKKKEAPKKAEPSKEGDKK